ncbi:hypothetical protein SprV_0100192200 [Sparganum proliferum]
MGVSFEFPDPLQPGDCITVVGTVGPKRFSMKFTSNFVAFDPDQLLGARDAAIDKLPVGDTVPLHVIFNTTGEWEVIGFTPETSSNASGFNAVRNGFKPKETFVCKVFVRTENFEVHLNGTCLSLSDHMIPVGCIQGVVIEGDCLIHNFLFGDAAAVEKSTQNALGSAKTAFKIQNGVSQIKHNLSAAVIECRLKHRDLQSCESLDCSCCSTSDRESNLGDGARETLVDSNPNENVLIRRPTFQPPSHRHHHSIADLPSLHRTGSYQLVFDVEDSDEEKDVSKDRSHVPSLSVPAKLGQPVFRAASCSEFLNSATDVQPLRIAPDGLTDVAPSILPSQPIQSGVQFGWAPLSALPKISLNSKPLFPSDGESGFLHTSNTSPHNSTDPQGDSCTVAEVAVTKTTRPASLYTRLPVPERGFNSKAAIMRRQHTPVRTNGLSIPPTNNSIHRFGRPVRPVSFHEGMMETAGGQSLNPATVSGSTSTSSRAKQFFPTSPLPYETQISHLRQTKASAEATETQNGMTGVSNMNAVKDGILPGRSCPREVRHPSSAVKGNSGTNQITKPIKERPRMKENGVSHNASALIRRPKHTATGTSAMTSLSKSTALRRWSTSDMLHPSRNPVQRVSADRSKDESNPVESKITSIGPSRISSQKISLSNHDSPKLVT